MPLKIGLTGGIGSGKTTVAKIFELLNVPVYYADDAAKNLYNSNEELMMKMKAQFGAAIYTNDKLNKSELAALVFNDPVQLEALNSLIHPVTIAHAVQWMQGQTAAYAIKEAALIFESGSVSELDYVIGVTAPKAVRLKRVMDRDGASRDAVLRRMDKQIDDAIKMKLCDFVITNNDQQLVLPQVLRLHGRLTELARQQIETTPVI